MSKIPELKKEDSRFNILHTEWGDFVRVEDAQQLEKTLWHTRARCADLAAEVYKYRRERYRPFRVAYESR